MNWPETAKAPRKKTLIAIPASLVSDTPHLREKTYKIGLIGRSAAIFRVDRIVIYPDLSFRDQAKDAKLIGTILRYLETPQYMRKKAFGIIPDLRYVGILHPLRTPHHPVIHSVDDLHVGGFHEGLVLKPVEKGVLVDIGVDRPVFVRSSRRVGERVTVKVTQTKGEPKGTIVSRGEVPFYWGYEVDASKLPLGRIVRSQMKGSLVIATSRYGNHITEMMDDIKRAFQGSKGVAFLFGSPKEGLAEILAREGLDVTEISDFLVNVIPSQGAMTVRTEEAVYASLSIFNAFVR